MVISPEFLTDQLHRHGFLTVGEVTDVSAGQRFQAFADEVVRLHLSYSWTARGHAPSTLICKVFGSCWYDLIGKPELHFYRDLASRTVGLPVPLFFGALDLPDERRCTLLIEDLEQHYVAATIPIADLWLEHLADVLAQFHASWWERPGLGSAELLVPQTGVMRMAQALDRLAIAAHEAQARDAAELFINCYDAELTVKERRFLARLTDSWAHLFVRRVAEGHAITLIHGDLHLLGNVFLARSSSSSVLPSLKIIDWGQIMRGLGPHDLMYALLSVDAVDRIERDTALLRRYFAGLHSAGVGDYSWQQCLWDYRFSLLGNAFQSVFQNSLRWFRTTLQVIDLWDSVHLLEGSV